MCTAVLSAYTARLVDTGLGMSLIKKMSSFRLSSVPCIYMLTPGKVLSKEDDPVCVDSNFIKKTVMLYRIKR